MTDRELLELAAKAAGIHAHHWFEQHGVLMCSNVEGGDPDYGWNPLEDDGDALRLAVDLHLRVDCMPWVTEAGHWKSDPLSEARPDACGDDHYAATRRAIVRAAAGIGKEMP